MRVSVRILAFYDFSNEFLNKFTTLDWLKGNGQGDLAYNDTRNIAALIPPDQSITYHLFDCNELKVLKKTKCQPSSDRVVSRVSFSNEEKHIT